jgi:hypothetical protein
VRVRFPVKEDTGDNNEGRRLGIGGKGLKRKSGSRVVPDKLHEDPGQQERGSTWGREPMNKSVHPGRAKLGKDLRYKGLAL